MNDSTHIYPRVKTSDQAIGSDSMPSILNLYFTEPGTFLDIGGNRGNALFFECDDIDLEQYIRILLELRERNPDLTIMLSTTTTGLVKHSFTCAFILHNKIDFCKRQKHLYNIGYYSIYPEKFQKQMEELYKNDNKSSE